MLKPADPGPSPNGERPVGELVNQLIEEGKVYARSEFNLGKTIATAKAKALAMPAALLGVAFLFALAGVTALAIGVVLALTLFIGPLGAGIAGLILFAAIAGGLSWCAVERLKRDL
jgi:hypothetical protein